MTDNAAKTKAELIEELRALRTRLAPQAAEDGKTEGTAEHAPVEGGAFFLHDRLRTLLEVTYELSQVSSFDDFCRQAVALGRDRLEFDRLGIWFFDEADPQYIVGSYGIDEEGHVRDERHRRHRYHLPAKTIRNGA